MSALSQMNIIDIRSRLNIKPNPAGFPVSRRPRNGPVKGVVVHYNGNALPFFPNAAREIQFVIDIDVPNHQQRIGMDSLAYHFVITSDGQIYQTRNLEYIAWHAGNWEANEHYLGIHFPLGGSQDATPVQWASAERLIAALRQEYGFGREGVTGHREWSSTSCPGQLMPRVLAYRAGTDEPADQLPVCAAPRISRDTFVDVLTRAQSPAASVAGTLFAICVEEGIDPAVCLGIMAHETKYNTAGKLATARCINPCAVRSCEDSTLGKQRFDIDGGPFADYPSYENAVRDFCKRLKGPKYAGSGLTTVEAIIPKYAPKSDGNDPATYIAAVRQLIAGWQGNGQLSNSKVQVTATTLNVRQGPATTYPVAGKLTLGDVVDVDSRKDEGQGNWYHLASGLGFVSPDWVEPV